MARLHMAHLAGAPLMQATRKWRARRAADAGHEEMAMALLLDHLFGRVKTGT